MNNETTLLMEKLKTIDAKMNERLMNIENITQRISITLKSNDTISNIIKLKKQYLDLIENENVLSALETEWCDVATQVAKKSLPSASTEADYDSLDSLENAIELMEKVIPFPNGNGDYNYSDFLGISVDFVAQYRNLLNARHNILLNNCQQDLEKITDVLAQQVSQRLEKYSIAGEKNKYNVGGVVFELMDKADIEQIIEAICEFENEKTCDFDIEYMEPTPLSQAILENHAKFATALASGNKDTSNEMKNEYGISIKNGESLGEKPLKLLGGKLVAVGKDKLEHLKNYFAQKTMNKDNQTEFPKVNGYGMKKEYEQSDNPQFNEENTKKIADVESEQNEVVTDSMTNDQIHNLNPDTTDVYKGTPEETEPTTETTPKTIPELTIDETLDGYVKAENAINNNPELTDKQKKQARDTLWNDFDKFVIDETLDGYVKVENAINNNQELTDEQKNQWRNTLWNDFDKFVQNLDEPVEVSPEDNKVDENQKLKALPNGQVYHERIVDTIDRLNETELEDYIKELHLTVEELEQFDKQRKEYMNFYRGVCEYMAKKACIKTIVSQREIANDKIVRTSTIESKAR